MTVLSMDSYNHVSTCAYFLISWCYTHKWYEGEIMVSIDTSSNSSLLQQVQQRQETLLERLATGRRVNSAADDSAAQQIIDRLTSQVEGNRQSISNAFDGVSLAQVAESGLEGINNDAQQKYKQN